MRVVVGEIDSRPVGPRLVIPTASQPAWPPFRRVGESIASAGRQLPRHVHEHEEVLTYVTEGNASYQLEEAPVEALPSGAARLLTAPGKVSHRVSPAQGSAIRWFNLVVGLPTPAAGAPRAQAMAPDAPRQEVDNARVLALVGPRAPMTSGAGLECQELAFDVASTTFARLGARRRAILYALAGQGLVAQQSVSAGEAALVEGLPAVPIQGSPGFRAIWATAPTEDGP